MEKLSPRAIIKGALVATVGAMGLGRVLAGDPQGIAQGPVPKPTDPSRPEAPQTINSQDTSIGIANVTLLNPRDPARDSEEELLKLEATHQTASKAVGNIATKAFQQIQKGEGPTEDQQEWNVTNPGVSDPEVARTGPSRTVSEQVLEPAGDQSGKVVYNPDPTRGDRVKGQ
jgi:hypothetical protein